MLPVEYSHCLSADLTTTRPTLARLLRANLTMAAVLFSGRVEGSLVALRSSRQGCRLADWRDAETLRLGDARDWPQPYSPLSDS